MDKNLEDQILAEQITQQSTQTPSQPIGGSDVVPAGRVNVNPSYPTEISEYLKQKYEAANMRDQGQTLMNKALANAAGYEAGPTTAQTDLVRQEIERYLNPKMMPKADKVYEPVTAAQGPEGQPLVIDKSTGQYLMPDAEGNLVKAQGVVYHKPEKQPGIRVNLSQEKFDYQKMRDAIMDERRDNPPANSDQSKAALFFERTKEANDVMEKLAKEGYDRAGLTESALSVLPGGLQPAQSQMQAQAERNFVNAVLRRESGAAISPSEFTSAEVQYFPRVGDKPEVVAQKAANRKTVIEGLKREGINALRPARGSQPTPAQPTSQAAAKPANEVERADKTGKIGIFDADTKQFLRWK